MKKCVYLLLLLMLLLTGCAEESFPKISFVNVETIPSAMITTTTTNTVIGFFTLNLGILLFLSFLYIKTVFHFLTIYYYTIFHPPVQRTNLCGILKIM